MIHSLPRCFVALALATSVGSLALPSYAVNLTFDNASAVGANINSDGSISFIGASAGLPVPVSGAGQADIGNGSWRAATGGFNNVQV